MHPAATTAAKIYSDRVVPVPNAKVTSVAASSQQPPSRPPSAIPTGKGGKEPVKTSGDTEDLSKFNDPVDQGSSASPDILRNVPPPNMVSPFESGAVPTQHVRTANGATSNHGFIPPQPYYGGALNVPSQGAFGNPQMQYFQAGYNPNPYPQQSTTARHASAVPKYPNMDHKYPPSSPLGLSNGAPQVQNPMTRRPSNYFVPTPMSPVQTNYAPRGWMANSPQMLPGPMTLQNGGPPIQSPPTMYTPAMLAGNGNPSLINPSGPVQPNYAPNFPPAAVPNQSYPFPPLPPESAVADIPPPIPSVYPDPAYSNIQNCVYNPKGTTNVYIRGLRPETTDEDLLRMVRNYGQIVSTKAIIDTQTKSCKGHVLQVIALTV
jgi:RNA recognition motif